MNMDLLKVLVESAGAVLLLVGVPFFLLIVISVRYCNGRQLGPRQTRHVRVEAPLPQVQERCLQALQASGATTQATRPDLIMASWGVSLTSWGTGVEIDLARDAEATSVDLRLWPTLSTNVVDFGRNAKLADELVSLISSPPEGEV
jgi:hypothetical protein